MRFGYCPAGARNAAQLIAAARAAEGLGIDQVWLTEDYLDRGVFSLAGALAASTEHIGIGIGVVNPWTRHPAMIAMEYAALDEASGGRATLGLGTSNEHWMRGLLGVDFGRPLAHLREAVAVIRDLLAGRRVDVDGEFFSVHAELGFTPLRTDPPLLLGVKGQRALGMVSDVADGALLPVLSSPAYVSWARQRMGPDVSLAGYVTFACDPDRDTVREAARHQVATYLGLHGWHPVTRAGGLTEEQATGFAEAFRAGRPAGDLVTDHMLDTFAVVGDEDDCRRGLACLAQAGLDMAILNDETTGDPSATLDALLRAGSSN